MAAGLPAEEHSHATSLQLLWAGTHDSGVVTACACKGCTRLKWLAPFAPIHGCWVDSKAVSGYLM